jgi:hypothetical protein
MRGPRNPGANEHAPGYHPRWVRPEALVRLVRKREEEEEGRREEEEVDPMDASSTGIRDPACSTPPRTSLSAAKQYHWSEGVLYSRGILDPGR